MGTFLSTQTYRPCRKKMKAFPENIKFFCRKDQVP